MPKELVFYTNPMSRGQIIRWMLEEVGQPYDTELLTYDGTLKGDAYKASDDFFSGQPVWLNFSDWLATR